MTRDEQYWKDYGYALAMAQLGLPHEHQGDRREACNVCGENDTDELHEQEMPRAGNVYTYAKHPEFRHTIAQIRVMVIFEHGGSLFVDTFLAGNPQKVKP